MVISERHIPDDCSGVDRMGRKKTDKESVVRGHNILEKRNYHFLQ
jgi:hypothetical protein